MIFLQTPLSYGVIVCFGTFKTSDASDEIVHEIFLLLPVFRFEGLSVVTCFRDPAVIFVGRDIFPLFLMEKKRLENSFVVWFVSVR